MPCVERELSRRKVFPCPLCETAVKRVTLSTRSLDDVQCEKDTSWRRRVLKVYNKAQSDFSGLLDWNNYLEIRNFDVSNQKNIKALKEADIDAAE